MLKHALALSVMLGAGACGEASDREDTDLRNFDYATQIDVPSPDYATMIEGEARPSVEYIDRIEADAPVPEAGASIGELWYERLNKRRTVQSVASATIGDDSAIIMMQTLLTHDDFTDWVRREGWAVPRHITFYFVPPMSFPAISQPAQSAVKVWPASRIRTGMQNMAAFYGKVYIEDGCVFVKDASAVVSLAWFLPETGLDVDDDGYLVLVDRITGWTKARLGETMTWAGPNREPSDDDTAALREACGNYPVREVGNPYSERRHDAERARAMMGSEANSSG